MDQEKESEILTLAVEGMYCVGCAQRIENVLKRTQGVEEAKVNFATSVAVVKLNKNQNHEKLILEKIQDLGYRARVRENLFAREQIQRLIENKRYERNEFLLLIVGVFFSIPFLVSMFFIHLPHWVQLLLAIPVQFGVGLRFHQSAWKSILKGGLNMDVLVSLGTNAAFFYSLFVMFFAEKFSIPSFVYFESSVLIITFVLLGKVLENIAKRRAKRALEDLVSLQPLVCHRVDGNQIRDIDISEVRVGDVLLVRAGENIPVDGVVIEGITECNESLLTGESLPVKKEIGSTVFAGTTNLSGIIKIQVQKTPEESTLSKIVELVEKAQNSKMKLQKIVDKVSSRFVFIVIIISFFSFVGSFFVFGLDLAQSILRAISVLVISCPCALGLATPIAILISTGISAKYGILFQNLQAMELLGKLQVLVFDKTGTLTKGQPQVLDSKHFLLQNDLNLGEIFEILYQSFLLSEHVLAKPIVEYLSKQNLKNNSQFQFIEFNHRPGKGFFVKSLYKQNQYEIYVGNEQWIFENKASNDSFLIPQSSNESVVCYSIKNHAYGYFLLKDSFKKEAFEVISFLKRSFFVVLATGDRKESTKDLLVLPFNQVYTSLKPEEKLHLIQQFQQKKQRVGMIGDGINDAPALSKADVSLSFGDGTSLAKNVSDIVLIHPDLWNLPFAIWISQKTIRKIYQNLFFAFAYNVISIPMASLGYLNPTVSALAMAMSSVSVVVSSLSLYSLSKERFLKKIKETK
ncbi:MAG: cation-translocating P-type ATPase [Leptospiraceae bacterium]|nr:cation-translocating P-type ATPase [Leptospiraceae bacterium]